MPTEVEITRVSPADRARSFGIGVYRAAYEKGCNVSQLLEREDPTDSYADGSREREMDAFERMLAAAGVVVAPVPEIGLRASTWQEVVEGSPETRAMLPELCARWWRQTVTPQLAPMTPQSRAVLLSGDYALNSALKPYYDAADGLRAPVLTPPIPLAALVARTTAIDGDAYRSLYLVDTLGTDAYRFKRIAEGTEIPATTLVTGEHTLRIVKYGRALRATYEQLRRQRLDRIAFIVARMAIQAESDKATSVLNVIVSGDGNANTAATTYNQTALHTGSAAGTLTLQAWLTFKLRFTSAYSPGVVLAQEAAMIQLLMLPVLTNSNQLPLVMAAGFLGSLTPLNQENRLAQGERYGVTADAPALKLVTFDPSQAVERVTEIGSNVSETERFIQNQTTMLTMTEVEGYGVIDPNASRILNINA